MARAALLALALCLAADAFSQPAQAPKALDPAAKAAPKKPAVARKVSPAKPAWAELTVDQQMILAPLKPDWEMLEVDSKRKWIGIANPYPKMQAQEQEPLQSRMHAWAHLTPQQPRPPPPNSPQIPTR